MRKHTKAGLVLLMAGMMMAGSVTSAFADTEATAATSGVIDTTKKNAETGGPGSTAASTENTLDGHTYSTEAPGSNTSQTQASTSAPETSASAESSQDVTSGQDNALTQDQANQLESEQAAAEAEAEANHTGPLSVPLRQPRLTTAILSNDSKNWSGAYLNDQQISSEAGGFTAICTYLENIFGDVRYRTYNSTTGWTGWAVGGQQTSFDGNAWYPVEAIQYRFAGPVNDQYDIYYCAQLSDGTETG